MGFLLNQVATPLPVEVARGWRKLGAVHDSRSGLGLSQLTYTRVGPEEACGDATVRLASGKSLVIRDLTNDGFLELFEIYCFEEPGELLLSEFLAEAGLADSDVTWRSWLD